MLKEYNVDLSQHKLYHYGNKNDCFNEMGIDTKFINSFFNPIGHLGLLKCMKKADKIIIHSLASPFVLMYLFLFPDLCKKVYWMVWGKDLYIYHTAQKKNVLLKVYEFFRKPVIKKIAYVVTAFEEDYDKAKEWYDVKGENIIIHMFYPNSVDYSECDIIDEEKQEYTILLGNSGSKTNRHIDAIDKLKKTESAIDKIYIPLSYGGSRKYAKKVKKYAIENFGEKCIPMMSFMPFEEYAKILSETDIAFFNHNRQEAVGNMYSMILKGKRVFLDKQTTTYQFLNRVGIRVGNVNDFYELDWNCATLQKNRQILLEYINIERAVAEWKKIFN